jgi:hypothetical protein
MSRIRTNIKKQTKKFPSQYELRKRRWRLVIDNKESVLNFYSILLALQTSKGSGLIDKEFLPYVNTWLNVISRYDPDIEKRANDTRRGPFRERDISPINITFELDHKEKSLMLYIWRIAYNQMITPETRDNWIKNQGQEDYELALKNYKEWINSLEGEGYIPENV